MTKHVTYLGVDDSVNICDCCGKSELKHTVGLDIDGHVQFYGVVCAGKALGKSTKNAKDVAAAVNTINKLAATQQRVEELRAKGRNVIYGRFYINRRTIKTHLTISEPNDLLVHQLYPKCDQKSA